MLLSSTLLLLLLLLLSLLVDKLTALQNGVPCTCGKPQDTAHT
jgi:hypothetical protein